MPCDARHLQALQRIVCAVPSEGRSALCVPQAFADKLSTDKLSTDRLLLFRGIGARPPGCGHPSPTAVFVAPQCVSLWGHDALLRSLCVSILPFHLRMLLSGALLSAGRCRSAHSQRAPWRWQLLPCHRILCCVDTATLPVYVCTLYLGILSSIAAGTAHPQALAAWR